MGLLAPDKVYIIIHHLSSPYECVEAVFYTAGSAEKWIKEVKEKYRNEYEIIEREVNE